MVLVAIPNSLAGLQESKGEAVIRKAVPIPENRMNLYTAQSQKLNSRNSQGYYGMFTGEYTDAK